MDYNFRVHSRLRLGSDTLELAAIRKPANSSPDFLNDPIPGLFNTVQFMSNNAKFMGRVQKALKGGRNIIRFHLGPKTVYLVAGPSNVKAVFGRDLVHQVTNQEQMTHYALPTLYKMNPREVQRWADDRSGVTKTPIPGFENVPSRQRLWYNYEHIYAEYIGRPQYIKALVSIFHDNMVQVLDQYPKEQWTILSVQDFCRHKLAAALVDSLFGPGLLQLTPDFIDRFWAFDEQVFQLVLGLPSWLNPKPARAHDRYVVAIERWLDSASQSFEWTSPEAEADWEPYFGGRAVRELYKWMKETDWRNEVVAATLGALCFALNSNSIPTTMWMLMEIIKDPTLLEAVREELRSVVSKDPRTGQFSQIDSQKLVALPLLQSIWTETLRLRTNFNIVRDVKEPVTLGGMTIPKGSLLQVPMMVAHYDEATWGAADHPASEFWAERHIKYTEKVDEQGQTLRERKYAMAGHPSSHFPFGGGANICPGRQLAKFEIFTTIALVLLRFDIELVEWTHPDGSPSKRAAESDMRYCGAGAMPPDRDVKIKLRPLYK
ncbi:putative cytochrome P450 [Pestalotiopsis sp. NC0098]|nr:putative cytochrome P450 [Pestalotiopsis sp. NC0098]